MNRLYLDIETLPLEKEKHHVLQELHQQMEEDGKNPGDFEQFLANTSFDGGFGRIACISYAVNDEPVKTLRGDERQMLKDFWELARNTDQFIGHNIINFDMRFIYQRSIVLGIQPSKQISFARYKNMPMYDTMHEWVCWDGRSTVSLDKLARILDLPTSKDGDITGKNVAQAFEDGRIDEICMYCEKDVELTRKIYKKMTFNDGVKTENDLPF